MMSLFEQFWSSSPRPPWLLALAAWLCFPVGSRAEVKKGNLGISVILSAVILGTSLVIMMSVH